MPRDEYKGLTIDKKTINELDKIGLKMGCKSRPEIIRILLRTYKKCGGC